MRLILFFDLPVVKEKQRRAYAKFVKEIKKQGFYMLQESVYIKMNIDDRSAMSSLAQVKEVLPPDGFIAVMKITEKQFADTYYLLGEPSTNVVSSDERILVI